MPPASFSIASYFLHPSLRYASCTLLGPVPEASTDDESETEAGTSEA